MNRHISRIAIVNRGEPAMRLINAVRELREEGDRELVAIALHTAAERRAMFVREADEAVAFEAVAGNPYLDFGALEPGGVATKAMRDIIADLPFVKSGDARVRITGQVALADEELEVVAGLADAARGGGDGRAADA